MTFLWVFLRTFWGGVWASKLQKGLQKAPKSPLKNKKRKNLALKAFSPPFYDRPLQSRPETPHFIEWQFNPPSPHPHLPY